MEKQTEMIAANMEMPGHPAWADPRLARLIPVDSEGRRIPVAAFTALRMAPNFLKKIAHVQAVRTSCRATRNMRFRLEFVSWGMVLK